MEKMNLYRELAEKLYKETRELVLMDTINIDVIESSS